MKGLAVMLGMVAILAWSGVEASAQEAGKKFGDAKYLTYEGTQSWPTGDRSTSACRTSATRSSAASTTTARPGSA